MKKSLYISIVIVLIGIVFTAWYWYQSNNAKQPTGESTQIQTARPETNPAKKSGSYIEYSEANLAKTASTKRILFFYAAWCPKCRTLDADIKKTTLPENITILKTDYDANQQLRKKYDVALQTTFILLDSEGKSINKYVAYDTPTYAAVAAALLK